MRYAAYCHHCAKAAGFSRFRALAHLAGVWHAITRHHALR